MTKPDISTLLRTGRFYFALTAVRLSVGKILALVAYYKKQVGVFRPENGAESKPSEPDPDHTGGGNPVPDAWATSASSFR